METVSVSSLKNNPSVALRAAQHDVVVVMNRDRPNTLMFRDGHLSLARAATLASMTVSDFVSHVSRLGIAIVRLSDTETLQDMDTLDEWLALS